MSFLLRILCFLCLLFLWLPLATVAFRGFSLEGFQLLSENTSLVMSFIHSLGLAISSGTLTMLFGLCTAFSIKRYPVILQRASLLVLSLPMILPEISFGISYLVLFQALGIELGWTTLLLAHVGFLLCYAVLILQNSVANLDLSILEAAQDLGAGTWSMFRHGLLPQLIPGMLAAFAITSSLSMEDFMISFFVKGIDQVTLPIKIFSMVRLKIGPEVYSLSLVLFSISAICVVCAQAWFRSSKRN